METTSQLEKYLDLVLEWNTKINLVSRKMSRDAVRISQLEDSVHIARFALRQSKSAVHDVGSGGGFPGIPIAILEPGRLVHLYEKVGKKANCLKEMAQALSLKNVRVHEGLHAGRVEGILTARAVFKKDELFAFAHRILTPKSILIVCAGGTEKLESSHPAFILKDQHNYSLGADFGSRTVASFIKK